MKSIIYYVVHVVFYLLVSDLPSCLVISSRLSMKDQRVGSESEMSFCLPLFDIRCIYPSWFQSFITLLQNFCQIQVLANSGKGFVQLVLTD